MILWFEVFLSNTNYLYTIIWFQVFLVVHLVAVKKFDKCLFTGLSVTVFILLANIFDCTFNLFMNKKIISTKQDKFDISNSVHHYVFLNN